jgi:hypothetical protein
MDGHFETQVLVKVSRYWLLSHERVLTDMIKYKMMSMLSVFILIYGN